MTPFLKKLTELDGVSGREEAVRAEVERYLRGNFEYTTDRIGNLYAHSLGYHPNDIKLMVSAHMDEVGLMITHITDKGFLAFRPVGGIDERILPGTAVRVGAQKIPGVIGSLAIHLQDKAQRETVTPLKDLYIDIGAADKMQAEKYVRVGDIAAFCTDGIELGDKLCAKALDDRVGCEVLLHLLQAVPEGNFTAVFSTREEIGCFGAAAAASAVKPRYAIVLEGTTAADTGGDDPVCEVGKGPVLSFMDNGTIYDRGLFRLACDVARKHGIPVQVKQAVAGGNEAMKIQRAGAGCKLLAISVPCRYIHAPNSVAARADIEAMKRLAAAVIMELK